ncbi:MAG: glycosyltransferase [Patescibacteria group bacterium]
MKVVMLSTDRTLLNPESPISKRMQRYATFCDGLAIILSGHGERKEEARGTVKIIYPGGQNKVSNFFNIVEAVRREPATVVSAQDPFWMGLAALLSGQRPIQMQIHTDHFGPLGILLAFFTLRSASCVRAMTDVVAKKARRMTSASVSVLPIFIDPEQFGPRHPRPVEFGTHPIVLMVARLAPEKRLELGIRTLTHVPTAHLYIIGDGSQRSNLERAARAAEVSDRVHFLGWRDYTLPYYQHADCFLQTSAYEGYGMALVEAMLSGCPVLSTDVGVAREWGATIVSPREYDIASAIQNVLENPEAKAAAERAANEFLSRLPSEEQHLAEYRDLLITCGNP